MMTPSSRQCIVLCGALLLGACATPRPSLDGDGDTYVSMDAVSERPFQASNKHPVIDAPPPANPWGTKLDASSARRASTQSNIVELGFKFYSNHLSKVDGPRCEHRPTCSRYALEAMREHGSVIGSWLTIDRLLRSNRSSSLKTLPVLKYHEGRPYFADPIDENDFFF